MHVPVGLLTYWDALPRRIHRMKNSSLRVALRNALAGVEFAFRNERNLRIQSVAGAVCFLALAGLKPGAQWIALVVLATGGVIGAELFNTAIERLADHVHPAQHPAIRDVKDCAAAAVLVCSITAVTVGVCLAVHLW
jgi:undecaprenol kinase